MFVIQPDWLPLWVVFAALGAFAFVSFLSPLNGLSVISAILPSYVIRLSLGGIPTTFLELCILILFIAWLLKDGRIRRINFQFWKNRPVQNPIPAEFRLPLSLLLIGAFVATLVSPQQTAALGILKAYFIEPLLVCIVAVYELRTREQVARIITALGLTTIAIGLYAVWQYLTGAGIPNPFWADPSQRRVTTFFGYPNANSLFVGPVVALYLGRMLKKQSLRSLAFTGIVVLLGVYTIFAARTAGALAALLVALLVHLTWSNRRRKIAVLTGFILSIIVAVASPQAWDDFAAKLEAIRSNRLDLSSSSLEIRINQWRETTALLADKPLFGAGLTGYQETLKPYHRYQFLEIYLYPHNLFLNFWVETGLLGVAALIWLLAVLGKRLHALLARASDPPLVRGLTYAWIVILIHGLVDVPYFKNDLSVLWMLLVALVIVAGNLEMPRATAAAR